VSIAQGFTGEKEGSIESLRDLPCLGVAQLPMQRPTRTPSLDFVSLKTCRRDSTQRPILIAKAGTVLAEMAGGLLPDLADLVHAFREVAPNGGHTVGIAADLLTSKFGRWTNACRDVVGIVDGTTAAPRLYRPCRRHQRRGIA
jgi:hypothetical protein